MTGRGEFNRWLWRAGILLVLGIGGLAAWLSFQPMDTWQVLGDKLAPDGSLEALTLIPEGILRVVSGILAILLIGLGMMMIVRPVWIRRLLNGMCASAGTLVKRFPADVKTFFHQLHGWPHSRRDRWILLLIIGVSILLRATLLDRPVNHDEAYTAVTWAPGPLRYIIEDYHLPNNHIFHTVLVSLTYHLFGSQPWSIRLPALFAGLLLIPAGYGLTRRWYGQAAGLIAAGLIAIAPVITDYSTIARGYSLFMLLSLLVFWLAARLVRKNNLFEWLLLVLFAALGFWTVPMMLYPFGAVCVWIGMTAFLDPQSRQAYGGSLRLLETLLAAGILTIFLTGLLYSPVLLHSGLGPLINNPFIAPLSFEEFWPTLLASRLPETLTEWSRGFGQAGLAILMLGVFLSLIFHRQSGRYTIHALGAVLLWMIPVLLLRRPNAWPRTWSYIYPIGFIWAAAGWAGLADWLRVLAKNESGLKWALRGAGGVILIAGLVMSFSHSRQICSQLDCQPGGEEEAVSYLQPRLEETDLVLVESPSNAVIWYYFEQSGLSREYFRKDLPFYRATILINITEDQTVESVITHFGFSRDWFEMDTLSLVHANNLMEIYQIEANKERVNYEYGIE